MNTDFASLCAEHKTSHTHEVADVEQLFKHFVIEGFIFVGAEFVAVYIHLDTALRVLQFHE